MIDQIIKDKLKKTFCRPLTFNDVFSSSDILNLKKELMANWTETRSYKGGKILFGGFNNHIKSYLKSMLIEMYPAGVPGIDFPWDDISIWGNVYFTSGEYGIHTDAFEQHVVASGNINIKNVIIPLDVTGENLDEPFINNLILMKNRLIDYDSTFQKSSNHQWSVKYQKNITDYSNLDWLDEKGVPMNVDTDKMLISNEEYLHHLTHIKEKRILEGFVFDDAYKYAVGSMLFHDSCQVHVTGHMKFKGSYVTNKMGVRLALRLPISSLP